MSVRIKTLFPLTLTNTAFLLFTVVAEDSGGGGDDRKSKTCLML